MKALNVFKSFIESVQRIQIITIFASWLGNPQPRATHKKADWENESNVRRRGRNARRQQQSDIVVMWPPLYIRCMFKAINTDDNNVSLNNKIGMKDVIISYHHTLGDCVLPCYAWEVSSILRNLFVMAMDGHKFSNVTISRV